MDESGQERRALAHAFGAVLDERLAVLVEAHTFEQGGDSALAAAAVALEAGVAEKDVRSGLRSFSPIEHRIEPAGTAGGVSFVNDSKATNTDSVEKALTAFPAGRIVLMLGGHDKMTDLSSLAAAVCHANVTRTTSLGQARRALS